MPLPPRPASSSARAPKGRNPRLSEEEDAPIRARANWPVLYAADAGNFEVADVDGKPVLLPVLVALQLRPGANMVTTRDKGQPVSHSERQATRYAEERGLVVIPLKLEVGAEHLPPGVDPGYYWREYPCQERKDGPIKAHYREAWDVAIATPPNEPQAFRFHRESFNKWRLHLLLAGLVPLPSDLVIERLTDRAKTRLDRIEGSSHPDPVVRAAKVEKARALVARAELAGGQAAA